MSDSLTLHFVTREGLVILDTTVCQFQGQQATCQQGQDYHWSTLGKNKGIHGFAAAMLSLLHDPQLSAYAGPLAKAFANNLKASRSGGKPTWPVGIFPSRQLSDAFLIHEYKDATPWSIEYGPALRKLQLQATLDGQAMKPEQITALIAALHQGEATEELWLRASIAKGRRSAEAKSAPVLEDGDFSCVLETEGVMPLSERDYLRISAGSRQPLHHALVWLNPDATAVLLSPLLGEKATPLTQRQGKSLQVCSDTVTKLGQSRPAPSTQVPLPKSSNAPGLGIKRLEQTTLAQTLLLLSSTKPLDWQELSELFLDLPDQIESVEPDRATALSLRSTADVPTLSVPGHRNLDLDELNRGKHPLASLLPQRIAQRQIPFALALNLPCAPATSQP
jgi:hypothetical protein